MKIPKTLKIGNLTYKVEFMSAELSDAKAVFGDSSVLDQRIRIGNGSSKEKQEDTFVHEIVHSVLTQAGYFEESKNEVMVKALANGLYQVLRDNDLLKK